MKLSNKLTTLFGLALLLASSVTSAAIVQIAGAPNSTINPGHAAIGQNNQQDLINILYGQDEMQNVVLGSDLTVNIGSMGTTIAAGTRISSHYIYYDPKNSMSITGRIQFDGKVLGLITERAELIASVGLGNPGVTYNHPALVGLESNDSATISATEWVSIDWKASSPGDYIRVITAAPVPVPAAVWFLGSGLLGLVGLRRKQQTA